MKNNTKLIMETWRRFLNEDPLDITSEELEDLSRKEMRDPLDRKPEGEPPMDPDLMQGKVSYEKANEIADLLEKGEDISQYSEDEIKAGKLEFETRIKEENPDMYNDFLEDDEFEPYSIDPFASLIGSEPPAYDSELSREELEGLKDK